MRRRDTPRRAHAPLSAHTLGRVLAVSLAVALALPAAVFVVANPGLAVAFAAGALVARAWRRLAAAVARVSRLPLDVGRRRPTSE